MGHFQDLLRQYSLSCEYEVQERNAINFFVCSVFEDFEIERKILNNRIFTKIKGECFDKYGVEIKLVDVNLGLDSSQKVLKDYYGIFNKYLNKHGICDRYNCPIFLLGQKYGRVLIPIRLSVKIYNLFRTTMMRYKKRFSVKEDLLDKYYILDPNSVDPEMMLKEVYTVFPGLRSNNKPQILEWKSEWKQEHVILADLFEKLIHICLSNGTLDAFTAQSLLVYELESSISTTLKRSINSNYPPIIYSREIIDIKNFIEISNINNNNQRKEAIANLIDVSTNDENKLIINEDSQALLRQCYSSCNELYENTQPPFRILWKDETGISETHHQLYIEQFVSYIMDEILEAVKQRASAMDLDLSPSLLKYYDMICDANLQTNNYSKYACGYEDICSTLLEYIEDESKNLPVVLYGPVNSGKIIILSRTIIELQNLEQDFGNLFTITRFVNSHHTINEILMSIFLQISAIVLKENQFDVIVKNYKEMENNIPKDIEGILYSFKQYTTCKFIIILHDLEKCLDLNSSNNFYELFPQILPDNMKLIVTSTANWNSRKPYFLNLSVPEFSQTEFNIFIQTQLNDCGKFLNEDQNEKLLLHYLIFTKDILTAKVLVNYLYEFQLSPTEIQEDYPNDINKLYIALIHKWYEHFGEKLISHILLFIYCSHGGLTDQEIVELINLDNEVMNELDVLHTDAIIIHENILRFSTGFWLLIKQTLSPIFIDKMENGSLLVDLATVTVVESLINSKSTNELNYFHRILAEYYSGVWCTEKKLFLFDSEQSDKWFYCYPRDQKMFSKYQESIFYNYRKFRQLVRHLSTVGMYDELLKEVIFNFDWLYNKIKALKVSDLLGDFQLSRNGGKEIILLEESIRSSTLIIENDLDSLAGELIVQLLPYVPYYPNLRFLIENCDNIAPKHNAFIPIYPTNKLPGSPLASTINCPAAIESVMVIYNSDNESNELLIKLKNDSRAYFYDLSFGEIVYHTLYSSGQVYLSPKSDVILILETEYRQIIKVHKKNSGDLIGQIIPMNWVVLRPFEERNKYKITNIDISKTKVALIITNEVSYLFVLNLDTLEPVLAFNPGVRLQMLKMTPDESTVFTHHMEKLVSLDIEKNQLNSAVELKGVPSQMIFSKEQFRKAFIVCENQKSVVVLDLELNGSITKCYKISFENCLEENDYVLDISCSQIGNSYLLIRSCHSVILYDWLKEKVLSHITRPSQLPIYFKLPNQRENQPASLQFNAAKLILSDRVILCALFRDIIVCAVMNNEVLKTLHAPVGGIVSEILIIDDYIIGKVDQSHDLSQVMIWKADPSCLLSKIETNQDKLTKSVNRLHVGESVSIATCENSDEMGVIEISTGTLIDLYSHSCSVINSCLSACGKWAFITVDNHHNANILWSLESRKIVFEFGKSSETVYVVPMKSISGFLCITNHSINIDFPNFVVTQISCDSNMHQSHTLAILQIENIGFICEEPYILNQDTILVFLSNQYKYENQTIESNRILTIWTRQNNFNKTGTSEVVTMAQLSVQIDKSIETILSAKSLSSNTDVILLLYKVKGLDVGIMLFNCKSKLISQFLDLYEILPFGLDFKDLFLSDTGCYLFHQNTCSVVDLIPGNLVGQVSMETNSEYVFRCFALRDTILVLSQKTKLIAWRLPEICKIGQVELKEEITCVSKCCDDFTLMIGCVDGSVLSYALVDIFSPFSFVNEIKIIRNFQQILKTPTIQLEPESLIKKTESIQEFDSFNNIKRPISEPVFAYERREFTNIL